MELALETLHLLLFIINCCVVLYETVPQRNAVLERALSRCMPCPLSQINAVELILNYV